MLLTNLIYTTNIVLIGKLKKTDTLRSHVLLLIEEEIADLG